MRLWLMVFLCFVSFQSLADICHWSQWNKFKQEYVHHGRVIDGSDPRLITTSEGQSYALFFALVANDKKAFSDIFNWTQQNLAGGDLSAQLPAWLWGMNTSTDKFGVLDSNSASDSDLWIAYSLIEAGRLWKNFYYQSVGYLLAKRILREETVMLDNGQRQLLPGAKGFINGPHHYRLNPSYAPLQLLKRMSVLYPVSDWENMYHSTQRMLTHVMSKGFSPDWVRVSNGGYFPDEHSGVTGSYNAIRIYLWVGMLNDADPYKKILVNMMAPMISATDKLGAPPEKVNSQSGTYSKPGNAGFSAALLPLLSSIDPLLCKAQLSRVNALLITNGYSHYYENVLALFGLGWMQHQFRFGLNGELQPQWSSQQCV
ncbi:cellulose synthase complex periplasmic endoglucanase BcsZ [Photobacterium damselae]